MWDGLNLNSLSEAAAGLTATVDSVFDNALNLDNLQKEENEGVRIELDAGSLAPSQMEQKPEPASVAPADTQMKKSGSPVVSISPRQKPNRRKGNGMRTASSPDAEKMAMEKKLNDLAAENESLLEKLKLAKGSTSEESTYTQNMAMKKRLDDLAAENASLMSEVKSLRASASEQPRSLNTDKAVEHAKALETRVIALEQEKEGLVGDKSKLEAAIEALSATEKEFADKVARKVVEAEELAIAKSSMAQNVAAMNKIVKEKEVVEGELREKLKTLSDKTRDVMKKYSESKETIKALEVHELEAKKVKSALSLKEGEVLSLKLKLENLERIVEDQKEAAASSADLKKKTKEARSVDQETIQSLRCNIDKLEGELEKAVSATAGLASEAATAQKALEEEKSAKEALQMKLDEAQTTYRQSAQAAASSHEEELGGLRSENQNLKARLEKEAETAAQHEDYKKRAQAALKKANASSSAVAGEVDSLHRQVEARDSEIAALQVASQKEVRQREREVERAAAQEEELRQLRTEVESLSGGKSEDLEMAHVKIEALKGELEATCQRLREEEARVVELQSERDAFQAGTKELARQMQERHEDMQQTSVATTPIPAHFEKDEEEEQELLHKKPGTPATVVESSQPENATDLPDRPTSPEQLFYVQELTGQLDDLKREYGKRNMEVNEAKMQILQHVEENARLSSRIEELENFLNRSKKSVDSDAVTNMEYLKALVFRFMATSEVSEKKRLFPVIATILNLTSAERSKIEMAIVELESGAALDDVVNQSITTISNLFA